MNSRSSNMELSLNRSPTANVIFPSDPACLDYILECPVCTELMTGIIRLCIMGHSMCEDCFIKLNSKSSRCPLCRQYLSPFTARNYCLENLAATCRFPCKFADRGCNKIMEGHYFKIHWTSECPFRDFKCSMYELEVKLQSICRDPRFGCEDFINHLVNDHKVPLLQNGAGFKRKCIANNGQISPSLVLIDYDDKIFFCNFQTHTMFNEDFGDDYSCFLMCWVGMISKNEDSGEDQKYAYQVTCDNDNDPENSFLLDSTDTIIDGKIHVGCTIPISSWPQSQKLCQNQVMERSFYPWDKMIDLSQICFHQKNSEIFNTPIEYFWKETITLWKSI